MADGHPQPYRLRYMELGNEERVDEKYAAKFEALGRGHLGEGPARSSSWWAILPMANAFRTRCTSAAQPPASPALAGHQRILQLAKRHDREVWFDVHVDTDHPVEFNSSLDGMFSFADALGKIADGARHKVVVFEFNAGNHAQKRALANALAINAIERDGRIPIVTSANCLQPDGQNDNGWNQGLLFLNPSQVWLQPPGYVTQMLSRNYLPQLVECQVSGAEGRLDANAKRSDDGKTLILQVVNSSEKALAAQIHLAGFVPGKPVAHVWELSGSLEAVNTADKPRAVTPHQIAWKHGIKDGQMRYTFPPYSFIVMRFD